MKVHNSVNKHEITCTCAYVYDTLNIFKVDKIKKLMKYSERKHIIYHNEMMNYQKR